MQDFKKMLNSQLEQALSYYEAGYHILLALQRDLKAPEPEKYEYKEFAQDVSDNKPHWGMLDPVREAEVDLKNLPFEKADD